MYTRLSFKTAKHKDLYRYIQQTIKTGAIRFLLRLMQRIISITMLEIISEAIYAAPNKIDKQVQLSQNFPKIIGPLRSFRSLCSPSRVNS